MLYELVHRKERSMVRESGSLGDYLVGGSVGVTRSERRAEARRQRRALRKQHSSRAKGLVAALSVGAALSAARPAIAATFTVTNTDDSGTGSLRQAITDAETAGGADTILFDSTVFATPQTISLLSNLPTITVVGGALTIQGPGSNLLRIRRDPGVTNVRIFSILGATGFPTTVNISGLTLADGSATANGGAIFSNGATIALNLADCVLTGNGTGNDGGGTNGRREGSERAVTQCEVNA